MGMITKTTKLAIDTPTPIPTALETRREKSTCKRYIGSQISKVQLVTLKSDHHIKASMYTCIVQQLLWHRLCSKSWHDARNVIIAHVIQVMGLVAFGVICHIQLNVIVYYIMKICCVEYWLQGCLKLYRQRQFMECIIVNYNDPLWATGSYEFMGISLMRN